MLGQSPATVKRFEAYGNAVRKGLPRRSRRRTCTSSVCGTAQRSARASSPCARQKVGHGVDVVVVLIGQRGQERMI